ncbi:MAG: 5'-nucleotidase C-terminal domain-containing protein [Bacteroidia bacterium]
MRNIFLLSFLLLFACHSPQRAIVQKTTAIAVSKDSNLLADAAASDLIQIYKKQLDQQMDEVIAESLFDLKKELPEGSLGNMVSDILMVYANKKSELKPDFCVLNHGGLRIPVIYQGPISVRTIFELLPFENMLVMVELKGDDCAKLFDLIADSKGAPIGGCSMFIQNNKATNILIQGKPFDLSKNYWVLTSDYIANGGDHADMMKNALRTFQFDVKLRDAVIEELKNKTKDGGKLINQKDGRIKIQ